MISTITHAAHLQGYITQMCDSQGERATVLETILPSGVDTRTMSNQQSVSPPTGFARVWKDSPEAPIKPVYLLLIFAGFWIFLYLSISLWFCVLPGSGTYHLKFFLGGAAHFFPSIILWARTARVSVRLGVPECHVMQVCFTYSMVATCCVNRTSR